MNEGEYMAELQLSVSVPVQNSCIFSVYESCTIVTRVIKFYAKIGIGRRGSLQKCLEKPLCCFIMELYFSSMIPLHNNLEFFFYYIIIKFILSIYLCK